jgi:hypothetical protein
MPNPTNAKEHSPESGAQTGIALEESAQRAPEIRGLTPEIPPAMAATRSAIAPEDEFYSTLAPFDAFPAITDARHYRPLPNDWIVGVADVVNSASAIAEGRYKAVNTVGAAVIAAVSNALPHVRFPFVFSGDGAGLATPGRHSAAVVEALSRTAAWAEDSLGLKLRVGAIPVSEIRKAGLDVRVARHSASPNTIYAMFSGGGLSWADARLKEGRFAIARAAPGAAPDLSDLYCDFAPIRTERGVIFTVIAAPIQDDAGFATLAEDVLGLLETGAGAPRPEASPQRELSDKTDFRKFEDALHLTVDCSPAAADAIEARLAEARGAGICRFGTHRQDAANLICITPFRVGADRVHFVDGATGGYAAAAAKLKADLHGSVG